MSSNLTRFKKPIVRHLPVLNLVMKFDEAGISIRAYRCRTWKNVTWAQLASLADDTEPVVKVCENEHGLRVLKALGVCLPKDTTKDPNRGRPA